MKTLNSLITISLCLTILGFFANFAQNDYGLQLVAYCMLIISILLYAKAFILIKHKKVLRAGLLLAYVCLFVTAIIINKGLRDFVIIPVALYALFFPTLIIPLIITITEFKKENKTRLFPYYFAVFIGLFCWGNYSKISHYGGATMAVVCGGFIILPILFRVINLIKKGIKEKIAIHFAEVFLLLFIGLNIDGFIFKINHWPFSKIITNISFSFFGLMLIVLIFSKLKKTIIRSWWVSQEWLIKTALIAFAITSVYYNLSRNDIVPKIYSNDYPPAFQEISSKSNDITESGKEFSKRGDKYINNYFKFLSNRDNANQDK